MPIVPADADRSVDEPRQEPELAAKAESVPGTPVEGAVPRSAEAVCPPPDEVPTRNGTSIEERLAALEERTAPKAKTPFEQAKDWGGIVSLVIAIAYSFPLGVWDRFIVSEHVRAKQEVAALRDAIDESSRMLADSARAMSDVVDPNLRDALGRAFSTRMYILMSKNRAAFERNRAEFVPPELLVIGYNFLTTSQVDAAIPFLRAAEESKDDSVTQIEATRLHAKSLFLPGVSQDRVAARRLFVAGAELARTQGSQLGISARLTLLADWGLLELLAGDWLCGQIQIQAAREEYRRVGSLLNDQGNFLRVLDAQSGGLFRREDQPSVGCG